MKYFLISILFISTILNAQTNLSFNKRYVESEDRWVAFQKNKDSSYAFGFIYIDEQAGLTFNHEGTFTIKQTGEFVPKKFDSTSVKIRLEPNNVLVAFIPESKFQELKISAVPEWLKYYKTDTNSVARLYHWGFMYNGWDECAKALTFLEKAERIDPTYKGLAVELAYSYNCLNQHDKAISVLQTAIQKDPIDAYMNKELIYAQIKSGLLDEAAQSCKKAIALCKDQSYNGENCYNLLHTYYVNKDRKNFLLWLDETKKWASSNVKMMSGILKMEKEMNN